MSFVEIRDVEIDFISILSDMYPTNEQDAVIKGSQKLDMTVVKADSIKGLLYVTPLIANYEDTQGEGYTNEEVEKATHRFMKKLKELESPSDTDHNMQVAKGVSLVEGYVDKTDDAQWKFRAVLDISENKDLMAKAKDGNITGVSIYGRGKRIQKGIVREVLDGIREMFSTDELIAKAKDFNDKEKENGEDMEIKDIVDGLVKALDERDAEKLSKAVEDGLKEKDAELEKAIADKDEMSVKVEELTKANDELKAELDELKKAQTERESQISNDVKPQSLIELV